MGDSAPRRRVLCAAPAFNEGERIARVVREAPRDWVDEVLVVDDGSTDGTAGFAREAGAVVIGHGRNRGVGAAIRTAIGHARENGFAVIVITSGGGKTPGRQIPSLVKPILDGEADFVQGSRYLAGGRLEGAPWHRRLGTWGYSLLFSLFLGRRVTDASSGFRAFRLSILDGPRFRLDQPWLDSYELEPYLLFQAVRSGVRYREAPVSIIYPPKADGLPYTKMRPFTGWWRIFRPVVYLRLGLKR
jgi:dolichol-phosphate mannosyltransferase